ncbi:hypothetical protein IFR05_011658 [Cadophora sp. M221]|nr:hypothetical protein IFR05_011658 [Cadophora sp. M221]
MDTEMDMDLGPPAVIDGGDGFGLEMDTGTGASRTAAEIMIADEMLARQLAAEEEQLAANHHRDNKRKASDSLSEYEDGSDMQDDESARPHTEFFLRPGKEDLEVSWDEDCPNFEIPQDAPVRAMIRRIVAQVALERGHEIAWITKCYLRGRWTESNVIPSTDNRYLLYAEHIEALFGYKTDANATPNSNAIPHESATIYIGPDDEWILEKMRLWRKSGGSTVVWNQDANLRSDGNQTDLSQLEYHLTYSAHRASDSTPIMTGKDKSPESSAVRSKQPAPSKNGPETSHRAAVCSLKSDPNGVSKLGHDGGILSFDGTDECNGIDTVGLSPVQIKGFLDHLPVPWSQETEDMYRGVDGRDVVGEEARFHPPDGLRPPKYTEEDKEIA